MTDTTRDAFEAWADNARPHQRLRSSTTDNYDYPLGTILFECWQAATLAERTRCEMIALNGQTMLDVIRQIQER